MSVPKIHWVLPRRQRQSVPPQGQMHESKGGHQLLAKTQSKAALAKTRQKAQAGHFTPGVKKL